MKMNTQLQPKARHALDDAARYARMLAGANDGLWERDLENGTLVCSPRWFEIIGHDEAQVEQASALFKEVVHTDDWPLIDKAALKAIEADEPYVVEFRMRHQEGHYIWVSSRAKVSRDNSGKAIFLSGAITEITDRKATEDKLRDFAGSTADRFWEMDTDFRFISVSDSTGDESRFDASHMLGKTRWELPGIDANAPIWQQHIDALKAHQPIRGFLYRRLLPDDQEIWIRTSCKPVFSGSGEFRGYRGTNTDVTDEIKTLTAAEIVKRQFHDAMESIPDAVTLYDADRKFVLANTQARSDFEEFSDLLRPGTDLSTIINAMKEYVLAEDPNKGDTLSNRSLAFERGKPNTEVQQYKDGRWIRAIRYPTADGGMLILRTDITDQKKIEDDLVLSEARFKDITEAVADYIWETDSSLRFTYFSEGYEQFTGIPMSEVIGKTREEFWNERVDLSNPVNAASLATMQAAWKEKQPYSEVPVVWDHPDGRQRHLKINALSVFGSAGEFEGYRGAIRDETSEVMSRTQAEVARQQFADAIEQLPIGVTIWDTDQKLTLWNNAIFKIYPKVAHVFTKGASLSDVLRASSSVGGKVTMGPGEEDYQLEDQSADGVLPDGHVYTAEGRHIIIRRSRLPNGYIISLHFDESERIEAARAAAAGEQMIQRLLSSTREGYWHIDNEGVTLDLNEAMCLILDRPREDVLGKSIFEFVDEDNRKIFDEQIELRQKGTTGPYEIELQRPDGTNIACVNNATPVYDENNIKTGSIGLWTDISPIRQTLHELEEAKTEAEVANLAKSEFLSAMSHELRTPMNAILGFSQLMQLNPKEPLTENQSEYVKNILDAGEHLLGLINQVLELSKIETGSLLLEPEYLTLSEVVQECERLLQPMAQNKNVSLTASANSGECVYADRARLKQVVLNLMTNGIKYNVDGGTLRVETEKPEKDVVRISVADTGNGILAKYHGTLFEPFNRAGLEQSGIEGTGIGLSISKDLVEAMGGQIGFESTPDVGSIFWIDLPVNPTMKGPTNWGAGFV